MKAVTLNRMSDVSEMTDVALEVVRALRDGKMNPKTSNALCSAVKTVYGGVRVERTLLRDMKPATPAKPGRKRLPPAAPALTGIPPGRTRRRSR